MMRRVSWLCVILLLTLTACSPRMERGALAPDEAAVNAWTQYEAYTTAREQDQAPYRLKASLRYGTEGDTRRVVALLWGNGNPELVPNDPVRLDVMAGFNSLVARIREADGSLLVYAPTENKALFHEGSRSVVLRFGKPVPFTLRDLSALMRGRFHTVFGTAKGMDAVYTPEGAMQYRLPDRSSGGTRGGLITIRTDGLPIVWEETPEQAGSGQHYGWIVRVDYDSTTPPMPETIRLTHPDGYEAILMVKDRQYPKQAFTSKQLALDLPAGVAVEPMTKD